MVNCFLYPTTNAYVPNINGNISYPTQMRQINYYNRYHDHSNRHHNHQYQNISKLRKCILNPFNNRPVRVTQCGILVFNNSLSRVLVVFQNKSSKWGLPKGHIRDDSPDTTVVIPRNYDMLFDCARREFEEETGLYMSFKKHKHIFSNPVKLGNTVFFAIKISDDFCTSTPIDDKEIKKARWLDVSSLSKFVSVFPCNSTLKDLSSKLSLTHDSTNTMSNDDNNVYDTDLTLSSYFESNKYTKYEYYNDDDGFIEIKNNKNNRWKQ